MSSRLTAPNIIANIETMFEVMDEHLSGIIPEQRAILENHLQRLRLPQVPRGSRNQAAPEDVQFYSLLWQNRWLQLVQIAATYLRLEKTCLQEIQSLDQAAQRRSLSGEELARREALNFELANIRPALQQSLKDCDATWTEVSRGR